MKGKRNLTIILLSNSFPYSGEPFLKTEMSFLPESAQVDIWPFFINQQDYEESRVSAKIHTHKYEMQPFLAKLICFFRGIYVFLIEKEFVAVLSRKHFLRNVVKAIKFAYISEMRLSSIHKWLKKYEKSEESIWIYAYWMYETAYVGARIKSWLPNSKFVTRCHGYDLYEERHPNGYLPFRNFILNQADLICPISKNGCEYLKWLYSSEIAEKISISRLGTIRQSDIPTTQEKEDAIVLVSCSNLIDVKRVHLIIKALKKCEKRVTWYHFGDGEMRASLEKQAETLPKNIQYRFMGYWANEEVQRFYADHYIDAFMNVSQSEGVPVSIMEAESYGIPIIATDAGGTSEIVHNGENGILLKVDFTDEELLSAIDNVLEKEDYYRAEAYRTWQTMSDALTVFPAFYQKLARYNDARI